MSYKRKKEQREKKTRKTWHPAYQRQIRLAKQLRKEKEVNKDDL